MILLLLSLAQFILTLDSTFMNVSISTLVVDLDTTVTAIQAAIAFYTLVMAAFMISGAKIGDIIGRKKTFIIGLIIYGTGSFITSISPNIYVLTLGWSVIEGLGAALVIPAMFSLISANFAAGPQRARAYGILAAVAASGAAVGPILGGFLTTYLSWRLGFLSEVFIAIYILLNQAKIKDASVKIVNKQFDYIGLILSGLGLATVVSGVLLANTYGLLQARKPFEIAGVTLIQEGGIAPTIWFVGIGLIILILFIRWQTNRIRQTKAVLFNPDLFKNRIIKYGVITNLALQFVMVGAIYAVSLVSQIMLEYNAFQSGLVLLPLSIAVLLLGVLAGRLSKRFNPKNIIQLGVLSVLIGAVLLGLAIKKDPNGFDFIPGLFLIGAGAGMALSQLNNLIQSSVPVEKSNETSGLNSTFQYLGSSLGTAVCGSLIISFFILSATNMVNQSSTFSSSEKTQINTAIETKAQTVSSSQLNKVLEGVPQNEKSEIISINYDAQQRAISAAVIALGILGLTGFITATLLPKQEKSGNNPD